MEKIKENKKIVITLIVIIILAIIAFLVIKNIGKQKAITLNKEEYKIESIVEANIYEITENNFIQGLDYNLTSQEVENVKNILLNKKEYTCKKAEEPKDDDVKYLMRLYDASESEIITIIVLDNEKIYMENMAMKNNEFLELESSKLKELIRSITN